MMRTPLWGVCLLSVRGAGPRTVRAGMAWMTISLPLSKISTTVSSSRA